MAALLAFGALSIARAAGPPAGPTPPPVPVLIDRNSVMILIRTTLVALHQANQTGNYSVLYSLSSPDFQKANSPERLAQVFANLRAKKFDLSGVVVLDPQLSVLPEMYSNGVMRMAGFFPSIPLQVMFDLQFIPVDGQWRLVAISVDVGTSTPAAPMAPTPNPALASSYSATPTVAPSARPKATPSPTAIPESPQSARPKATPSPTAIPESPQSAKAKATSPTATPESAQSPAVQINVKPKRKPTPTPTPRRKI